MGLWFWIVLNSVLPAATFYVSPTGDDSAAGSSTAPFRTVQRGVNAANPGDTVLLGEGVYPEAVKTARSGSASQRIVIDGQGAAAIRQITLKHSYVTAKRLTISGTTQQYLSLVYIGRGAHFTRIEDCVVDANLAYKVFGIDWQSPATVPFGSDAASDCLITGTTIKHVLATTMVSIKGDRNVIENCKLLDSGQVDFFRLWGRNNVIRGNLCRNNYVVEGQGNHPDFIQTFGNLGFGSVGHIIEGNIVNDTPGAQLTQLEANLLQDIGDWTFRNNVFMNIGLQASCTVRDIKYYNNVFYRCNHKLGGFSLVFGARYYDRASVDESSSHYAAIATPVESGGIVPGQNYIVRTNGVAGAFITYNGEKYEDSDSFFATTATTFTKSDPGVNLLLRLPNFAHGVKVFNNVFLDCGDERNTTGWYSIANTVENAEANYNFVTKNGFAPVRINESKQSVGGVGGWNTQLWWEPNGINGGDPRFANPAAGDFRVLLDSPLIDHGFSIASISKDFAGTARPHGNGYDIGPFEYASGITIETPILSVSRYSVDFADVEVGTSSDQTLSVQNAGSGTLNGSATVSAPFSVIAGGSYSLAAGQSQAVKIRYTPTVAGTHTQSVTLTGGGGATVPLTGSAIGTPAIALAPAGLDFGSVALGSTATQTFTVQNTGTVTLTGSASVAAPFTLVAGGSYDLAPGQSQAVSVKYTPTAIGTHRQNVAFSGGGGASATVTGIAIGTPVITVAPAGLDFGSTMVGETATQTLTVQNTGTATLTGSASVAAPFTIVTGGSYNLAPGQSQAVNVKYTPTAVGTHSQTVEFTGGGGASVTVTGSAAGTPSIAVTPAALNFGSIPVGTTATQTLTVENTGTATLTGSASVADPFSIVSGGSYSLTPGQSQVVSVMYTPTAEGTHTQDVAFTGAGGASSTVTGNATITAPTVGAITQNGTDVNTLKPGWQVYAGSVVQYSGSASDPNNLPLTWQWVNSFNGGAETVVSSGSGPVTSVSYNYTADRAGSTVVWKLRVSNGFASAESSLSVAIEAAPDVANNLTFSVGDGEITAPFTLTDDYISQPGQTLDPADGGRAVFNFTISDKGNYIIQARVSATGDGNNSLFLNIDAEPESPTMVWDVPVTAGFEQRILSWRGDGTFDNSQFVPKIFTLTPGQHQVIIRGREANTQLSGFSILKLPEPPRGLRVRTRP